MIIDASFVVPATADAVLDVLSDPAAAAAALPGSRLRDRNDDGSIDTDVYLPLGKGRAGYRIAVIVTSFDREAGAINLESAGHELRGKGTWLAGAAIRLRESAGSTTVSMQIDLDITGRAERAGEDAIRAGFVELAAAFGTALAAQIASGGAVRESGEPVATPVAAGPDRSEWPRGAHGDGEVLTGSGAPDDEDADTAGAVPPWWRIDIAGAPPAGEAPVPRTPDGNGEEVAATRQDLSPAWPTAPTAPTREEVGEQEQPAIAVPFTAIASLESPPPESPSPPSEPASGAVRGRVKVMTDGPIPSAGIPVGDSVGARLQALNRDKPWAIPAALLAALVLVLMVRRRRR